jgi:phosphatidylserine/phosphatidylglycerophosphate/cardiolipin synthase-like enzyme
VGGAFIDRLDALAGDGIEAAVRAKHRVRLRRLGWQHALERDGSELWARGSPPPRPGCSLEVLIDGASALPELARALSAAGEYVRITGWHVAPYFELERDEPPVVLGELLAELAERVDVRVLVWAGAPVPLFHPTRSDVRRAVRNLVRDTRIRCVTDPREHPFHCHHEKTVVVDGKVAFVGGIDLTDAAGDRFDFQSHPARRRIGWHDVAARLTGPAVKDVDDHFVLRWREVTGEQLEHREPPPPTSTKTVQVVRTVSDGMYKALPYGEFRILESYVKALHSAQRLIYLENQFLWAPELVALLADKLRNPPREEFRLVVLVPARANNGQDDTAGQLGVLADADDGHGRFLAATVRSLSGHRDDPLYVHAKVGIVDDRWLTIGSANLNAHSLLNDTELNVVCQDPELVRDTRLRLWSEHLELDRDALEDADPRALVDERWRPVAMEQLERLRAGAPSTHRLLALPGISRRSRRLLGPLTGLVDDA